MTALIVGSVATSRAELVIPPGAEPEAFSLTPGNLRKGTNLPYLIGNTGYVWCRKIKNPFDKDRLVALVTAEDLQMIKAAGFDHIRIPIDPEAVGFRPETNVVDPDKVVSHNGNTAAHVMSGLKEIITLATSPGINLAVVIGLQPEFISQKHYDRLIGWDPTHTTETTDSYGWHFFDSDPNNAATLEPSYYGGWKQDFCTSDPITNPIGPNHKLAKFWDGFLNYFNIGSAPPDKVYFGILDEPMAAFNNANTAHPYNPNQTVEWRLWFSSRISEWRSIQLEALKVCLAKPVNWKFIASSAIGDPREFSTDAFWQNGYPQPPLPDYYVNSNWPMNMPTFGNPYSPFGPDNIGAENMDDVIYSPNVYAPLKYTHFGGVAGADGEYYDFTRDYKGLPPLPPTPPAPPLWDAMELGMNKVQNWVAATSYIGTIENNGMIEVWAAPIYITGFGVSRRHVETCEPGVCLGNSLRTPGYKRPGDPQYLNQSPGGPAGAGGMRELDDRYIWHYDVRQKAKQNGWGWATWEWWGHWRVSYSTAVHMWGAGMPANKSIHTRPPTMSGPQNVPCRGGLDMDGGIDAVNDAQFGMAGSLFNWTARPRPW